MNALPQIEGNQGALVFIYSLIGQILMQQSARLLRSLPQFTSSDIHFWCCMSRVCESLDRLIMKPKHQ